MKDQFLDGKSLQIKNVVGYTKSVSIPYGRLIFDRDFHFGRYFLSNFLIILYPCVTSVGYLKLLI